MDIWYDGTHGISFYELNRNKLPLSMDMHSASDTPIGRLIGHTWKDWDLVPLSAPFVAPAAPKESSIEIPGANGTIDTSNDLTGWPLYSNRTGSWAFYCAEYFSYEDLLDSSDQAILDNYDNPILASVPMSWSDKYTQIANAIHGKYVAVVLDDDPDYFWYGRVKITQWANSNDDKTPNGFSLDYDLYPFKFRANSKYRKMDGTYKMDWSTTNKVYLKYRTPSDPQDTDYDPDIPNSGGATSTVFYIKGGQLPVIPRLYTIRAIRDQDNPSYKGFRPLSLSFKNPELKLDYKGIKWSSDDPRFLKLENLITSNGSLVDFTVTNLSGDNVCELQVTYTGIYRDEHIQVGNDIRSDNVLLLYWVGEL